MDARIWEQAGRRKGQVLHQILWLLSFSLVLKKSSKIRCNAKEPVSLDMFVSQPTCSSSTSSSGGPVLGTRSREAGGERSDDAPTVLWHHLPVEGASLRLPELRAHLILWLRRHLHPPTALLRRWRPPRRSREGRRGGFQEDAWKVHLAVVAARECTSDTWWISSLDFLHVYFRDLDVILLFFLVQNVSRAVLCSGTLSHSCNLLQGLFQKKKRLSTDRKSVV